MNEFQQAVENLPGSVMSRAFDSQSFVPDLRLISDAVDVQCWLFLTRKQHLHNVFYGFLLVNRSSVSHPSAMITEFFFDQWMESIRYLWTLVLRDGLPFLQKNDPFGLHVESSMFRFGSLNTVYYKFTDMMKVELTLSVFGFLLEIEPAIGHDQIFRCVVAVLTLLQTILISVHD